VIPAGGYVRFSQEALLPLPWYERVYISSAGVVFNLLLAFSIFLGEIRYGSGGLPQLVLEPGIRISGLVAVAGEQGSNVPAARGKLRPEDVIVAVNGERIHTSLSSPSDSESERAISGIIKKVQATKDGESVRFSIIRKGSPNRSIRRAETERHFSRNK
jgi:S1-C subfamily serine protease